MSIFSLNNKKKGDYGEKLACRYLRKNGYRIVKRNYNTRHGEIDIIARNKKHIAFCEVKTRTQTQALQKYGRPAKAVNAEKRRHIIYAVKNYLRENKTKLLPRLDIIEVYLSPESKRSYRIEHIKGAFNADTQ